MTKRMLFLMSRPRKRKKRLSLKMLLAMKKLKQLPSPADPQRLPKKSKVTSYLKRTISLKSKIRTRFRTKPLPVYLDLLDRCCLK
jgi:hypothetical protein